MKTLCVLSLIVLSGCASESFKSQCSRACGVFGMEAEQCEQISNPISNKNAVVLGCADTNFHVFQDKESK